jgi:hypothetical protein
MIKGRFKIKVLTDRFSGRGQITMVEIYDPAAALTNQMVMGPVGHDLELGTAPS